jgi:hypothetical protein
LMDTCPRGPQRCSRSTTFWCERQGVFMHAPGCVRLGVLDDTSASDSVFLTTRVRQIECL